MHPFWAVRRCSENTLKHGEVFNCAEQIVLTSMVIMGAKGTDDESECATTWQALVPCLVNTLDLPKSAELLCEMEPPSNKAKKKERTWQDDVKLSKKAREGVYV